MTSSSTTENFNLSKLTSQKTDGEVNCHNTGYEVSYLEDAHLTQDFQALAKLQNPSKQVLTLQESSVCTAANFDENLLTNVNFQSVNIDNSYNICHNEISNNSDTANSKSGNDKSTFISEHFNIISTDDNKSKFACKSHKYHYPQLDDSIAKRTRSKLNFTQYTPSADCNLPVNQICNSFETNGSLIPKSKIHHQKSKTVHQKSKMSSVRKNNRVFNIPQPEKNCPQFNTFTNTELKEARPDDKRAICESTDFNKKLDVNKNVKKIEKQSHENNGDNRNLSSSLITTIENCIQSEECTDLNILYSKKLTHENAGYSADVNSTLNEKFQNFQQLEIMTNLNKIVLDSEKETNENIILPFKKSMQSEDTVIDIIYQLDEFDKLVNNFKAIVISELNKKSTSSETLLKETDTLSNSQNENKIANDEEELFISEMENEYEVQFNMNEGCISDEKTVTFPTKMPKWESEIYKYNGQVSNS